MLQACGSRFLNSLCSETYEPEMAVNKLILRHVAQTFARRYLNLFDNEKFILAELHDIVYLWEIELFIE